jgi:hypothetical protein
MNKKTLEFLVPSIISIFGGVFLLSNPFIGIPAICLGLFLEYRNFIKTSREINKKIEGDGIGKITISEKEPTEPKEGDLWIDKRKIKN